MKSTELIEIVSATRLSEPEFWEKSALGLSLKRLAYDKRICSSIAFSNRLGLPVVYNSRILANSGEDLIVFIHDDVWIDDYFLADRLADGLQKYDVVGLAGNRRRLSFQATWASAQTEGFEEAFVMDDEANLSGAVAHGADTCSAVVTFFGSSPDGCELMDGLFLAARRATLTRNSVLFDPRFDFHFYDLDFCRTARQKGLRIGTWPIAVTHQSSGTLNSQWFSGYRVYLEKWET